MTSIVEDAAQIVKSFNGDKECMKEMDGYFNAVSAFASQMGIDPETDRHDSAVATIVGYNSRTETDEVMASFDRAIRVLELARAMYAENPSHAPAADVPELGTHCVLTAISHAAKADAKR